MISRLVPFTSLFVIKCHRSLPGDPERHLTRFKKGNAGGRENGGNGGYRRK